MSYKNDTNHTMQDHTVKANTTTKPEESEKENK